MKVLKKFLKGFYYFIITIKYKICYGNKLNFEGLFRKRIDTEIVLKNDGNIFIGKGLSVKRNVSITSVGGSLSIGSGVSFNRNCLIGCRKEIKIGNDVMVGPGVTIYDHDHVFTYEGIQSEYKCGSVVIENGCWIGANVTILRNTYIGEGSVIGAGVLVKGNVPPHSLVTSNRNLNIIPIKK